MLLHRCKSHECVLFQNKLDIFFLGISFLYKCRQLISEKNKQFNATCFLKNDKIQMSDVTAAQFTL